MADSIVIRDVSKALKELIEQNILINGEKIAVVYKSPGEMGVSESPKLSLFLYQVTENNYLSNEEEEYIRSSKEQKYPPIYLDLYFLITPYASDQETEMIIVEELIKLMNAKPILQDLELNEIRIVSHNQSLDELKNLWQTFPGKSYKISLSYLLTPVRVPSAKPPVPVNEVEEVILTAGADWDIRQKEKRI